MRIDHYSVIQKLYDYFCLKLNRQTKFKISVDKNVSLKQKNKNFVEISNFLTMLSNYYMIDSVGINFLIDYFCFSFEQWRSADTNRQLSLNWIVGKKMFGRWLDRDVSNTSYFIGNFVRDYSINVDHLKRDLVNEKIVEVNEVEELEKSRYIGDARLYNCILHTSLYTIKSRTCLSCEHSDICKKIKMNGSIR